MFMQPLRAILAFNLLIAVAAPLDAKEAKPFKQQFDGIMADFRRETNAARGDRQELVDAKQRFDTRLQKCLEDIRASGGGSPAVGDLIVAVAIAEQLSKSDEVVELCDQILRRDPDCDAAIYARLRGLIGVRRLDDAELHVRQALRGAEPLSDRYSMCGLLLGAFNQDGKWSKGVEYGTLFLTWCSAKIRAEGGVNVAMSSFVDLFEQCADKAGDERGLNGVVERMLGDVSAAIDVAQERSSAKATDWKQIDFLFQLKHKLCCLSANDDPAACVADWLKLLTVSAKGAQPPPPAAIAEGANAGVSSLALARDLDAVKKSVAECLAALEYLKPASKVGEPINSGVAALKRLESMIEIERELRGMKGKALDLMDKADWHHNPARTEAGPMIVYVWSPSGRNPGLTLRNNLSKIRDTIPLPLTAVSPYTENPAAPEEDAAAGRRQKEGAAIRKLAGAVSDKIAVACIEGRLLSETIPAGSFPQVYLLDSTGSVELAVVGIDRWRLKRLRVAAANLSKVDRPSK